MGSGVAKLIREKFPAAYDAYRQKYKDNGLELGTVIFAETNDKVIANAITQENYGRSGVFVDYNAIACCMWEISKYCRSIGVDQFALPKIGAGLGGGNWEKISKIIEEYATVTPVVYYF